MAAPDFNTWDGDPANSIAPRLPSTDDLGRDDLEDDADDPPDPNTMPTAGGWNQRGKQIASIAQTTDPAKLYLKFNAGAPQVFAVLACGTQIDTNTFTVTDLGAGETRIEWPANTFPASNLPATSVLILASSVPSGPRWPQLVGITNGIEVRTYEGTSATDFDCIITL